MEKDCWTVFFINETTHYTWTSLMQLHVLIRTRLYHPSLVSLSLTHVVGHHYSPHSSSSTALWACPWMFYLLFYTVLELESLAKRYKQLHAVLSNACIIRTKYKINDCKRCNRQLKNLYTQEIIPTTRQNKNSGNFRKITVVLYRTYLTITCKDLFSDIYVKYQQNKFTFF
jgi:hypothetical protein